MNCIVKHIHKMAVENNLNIESNQDNVIQHFANESDEYVRANLHDNDYKICNFYTKILCIALLASIGLFFLAKI